MVSATWVGGQREKHSKTIGFCVGPRPKLLKRCKNHCFFDDFGVDLAVEIMVSCQLLGHCESGLVSQEETHVRISYAVALQYQIVVVQESVAPNYWTDQSRINDLQKNIFP